MQIDLANTLVRKVYSIHNDISPQALFSPPLEGLGEAPGCALKRGGHTDKRVNHKMDFDFEFD